MRNCLECNEEMLGRTDQKFCSVYCKSAYHYKASKEKETGLFKTIDNALKLNRRILKEYNKGGKTIVRKETLLNEGFNPNYFTHYWKNSNNQVYLFCYEFGFLETVDNHKPKYVLVKWQDYMKK